MKLISWNVNGIRACLGRDFAEAFAAFDADIICLQEVKAEQAQVDFAPPGYHVYWNAAQKKGYSGTAVFTRMQPLSACYGIGCADHDSEGRVITLEFADFFVVNVYTPNSRDGLVRLDYRMTWEDAFRAYVCALDKQKPVLICGDLNVAHREIDLARPGPNRRNPGFTDEERGKLSELLDAGFVDTFRTFYPEKPQAYSWWSYRAGARERNVGWRIDYWLCSQRFAPRLAGAGILTAVYGSDHCPVSLEVRA
ncbi:MAG: exodeoxyribonuclease III [Oscillospiraceae bacterium]|nr:exodeoxyribonuclease III [Oscillospiraceae bacterium]